MKNLCYLTSRHPVVNLRMQLLIPEGANSARLLANSEVSYARPPWLANEWWPILISRIWRTIRSSEHLRHPKRRELRRERLPVCHKTSEGRLIMEKHREAPRIDYGVKRKASLLNNAYL